MDSALTVAGRVTEPGDSSQTTSSRQFSATVGLMLAIAACWVQWRVPRRGDFVDLDVYLRGARAIMEREQLYAVSVHDLPFTYSPFAAASFIPWTVVPVELGRVLFTAASLLGYVVTVMVVGRSLGLRALPVIAVGVGGLAFEGFHFNMVLGQINLILMAMVAVDCLVLPPRYRGWLIGIAAGVKLIPGVFVLLFILRRDWRSVIASGLGLAATIIVGFVVAPNASRQYWSGGFAHLGRWGDLTVVGTLNQSLSGVWMRLNSDPHAGLGATLVFCILGTALGILAARRQLAVRGAVGAMLALALGGLLGSPISWTHHWLWMVPALLLLVANREWMAMWLVALVFWVGPPYFDRGDLQHDLHLAWWEQATSATYVIAGLAVLALLSARPGGRLPRGPVPE